MRPTLTQWDDVVDTHVVCRSAVGTSLEHEQFAVGVNVCRGVCTGPLAVPVRPTTGATELKIGGSPFSAQLSMVLGVLLAALCDCQPAFLPILSVVASIPFAFLLRVLGDVETGSFSTEFRIAFSPPSHRGGIGFPFAWLAG